MIHDHFFLKVSMLLFAKISAYFLKDKTLSLFPTWLFTYTFCSILYQTNDYFQTLLHAFTQFIIFLRILFKASSINLIVHGSLLPFDIAPGGYSKKHQSWPVMTIP